MDDNEFRWNLSAAQYYSIILWGQGRSISTILKQYNKNDAAAFIPLNRHWQDLAEIYISKCVYKNCSRHQSTEIIVQTPLQSSMSAARQHTSVTEVPTSYIHWPSAAVAIKDAIFKNFKTLKTQGELGLLFKHAFILNSILLEYLY